MPERIADVKSVFFRIWSAAQTSLQVPFLQRAARRGGRPGKDHEPLTSIRTDVLGEQFGNGFGLGTSETACEILGQERIALGASDGFLRVFAVGVARTGKGDQRGGKFHLRVVATLRGAAQSECL